MHHFTGSTLEAKIQYIILLKHHFTGSFLKKNRLRRTSFYWGIILPGKSRKIFSQNPILLEHNFTRYVLYWRGAFLVVDFSPAAL